MPTKYTFDPDQCDLPEKAILMLPALWTYHFPPTILSTRECVESDLQKAGQLHIHLALAGIYGRMNFLPASSS